MNNTVTVSRYNGFCRRVDFSTRPRVTVGCGKFHSVALESQWSTASVDCGCGERVGLRRVEGNVSEHECDDRCMESTGFKCECKCGGLNHGKAA